MGDFSYVEGHIALHAPPVGKVQALVMGHDCSFIEWAPGDGYIYHVIIQRIPDEMRCRISAEFFISVLSDGQTYHSYPANPGHVYEINYVGDKWKVKELRLYLTACLMNWALFGHSEYAEKLWAEMLERWPHAVR